MNILLNKIYLIGLDIFKKILYFIVQMLKIGISNIMIKTDLHKICVKLYYNKIKFDTNVIQTKKLI